MVGLGLNRSHGLVECLGLGMESLGYFEFTGHILLFQRFENELSFTEAFGRRIQKSLSQCGSWVDRIGLLTHEVSSEDISEERRGFGTSM